MGICIDISEKWLIKSDSHEFSLYKLGVSEKGDSTELVIGHYSCVDHCLKWLINKEISTSDCTTLKEIVELIKDFRALVEEQLGIGIQDYSLEPAKQLGERKIDGDNQQEGNEGVGESKPPIRRRPKRKESGEQNGAG